jgi:hypothetical protein
MITIRTLRKGLFAALFVLATGAGLLGGTVSGHTIPAAHPIAADTLPLPPVI